MTADSNKGAAGNRSIECLVCNASVGVSTRNSCPIFHYNVGTTGRPLAKVLSFVLNEELVEEEVHSIVICKKCFKLINEVDELQDRLKDIMTEMKGYYVRTLRRQEEHGGDEENEGGGILASSEDDNIIIIKQKRRGRKKPLLQENKKSITEDMVITIDEKDKEKDISALDNLLPEVDGIDGGIGHVDVSGGEGAGDEPVLEQVGAALMAGNDGAAGGVQIKVEVVEVDVSENVLTRMKKPVIRTPPRKKIIKKPAEEMTMIPRMVVSRDAAIYTCLLCSAEEKFMSDMKQIAVHMKEVHSLRLLICDICGQPFLKRSELSAHLDEHAAKEDGDYQCDVCNRIFNNLRLFRVHKRMHAPQIKNWTCDQCGKRYLSRNMLDEHMNVHKGIKPYTCDVCGKCFASKYTFRSHEKTHTERPRPFACNKCEKSFLTSQNLMQHTRTHSDLRSFVCTLCGKGFSTSRNLEVHCVVHSGFKPFICRLCGKAFARKAEIKDHERTHTGEKPYQCEYCGATFGQRSNLQSHRRATHYDDKRYKCMDCGKAFKRRRLLDYHMKAAHTGERPYKCSCCSATFIYPEHFKKHGRIHTGEKPFHCEVCGKAFNSRDNRNAHRFVHSDKKPYECLICGMGFMRKPLLYNHMQTQGHLNDTIVVNQPRLTTEEDLLASANNGEHMEIIITDSDGNQKIVPSDQLQVHDLGSEDQKMFLHELKEHVIIQHKGDDTASEVRRLLTEPVEEMIAEGDEYTETVEHLIIDGQVHFANPNAMVSIEEDGGEIASVAEISTTGVGLNDGRSALVVPASRHHEYDGTEATILQSEDGAVQHLVRITIPSDAGDGSQQWFNIVQ